MSRVPKGTKKKKNQICILKVMQVMLTRIITSLQSCRNNARLYIQSKNNHTPVTTEVLLSGWFVFLPHDSGCRGFPVPLTTHHDNSHYTVTTISVLCRSLDINSNINPTLLIKFVESGRCAVNLKSVNRSTTVLSYCTVHVV